MDFKKYSKIIGSYSVTTVNKIFYHGFSDRRVEWCVLLKVHGANLGVYGKDGDVMFASKEGFMEDDNLPGFWSIKDEFTKKMREFTLKNPGKLYTFYGELFGGSYPHPDVKKMDISRVQKGVFYCPHVTFYLVDVMIDGVLQDHDTVIELGEELGVLTAIPLMRGTFDECLAHSNEFPDPLHKQWGLPEIEDNVCEGIVIKPVKPLFFNNGRRVILKNKNDKFAEKASNKKHPRTVSEPLTERQLYFYDIMCDYITEARLRNVLSHGTVVVKSDKDFGKLLGELNKDMLEDFLLENDDFLYLDTPEQKRVKKLAQAECANLIRKNFVDMLEGVF